MAPSPSPVVVVVGSFNFTRTSPYTLASTAETAGTASTASLASLPKPPPYTLRLMVPPFRLTVVLGRMVSVVPSPSRSTLLVVFVLASEPPPYTSSPIVPPWMLTITLPLVSPSSPPPKTEPLTVAFPSMVTSGWVAKASVSRYVE